MPLNAHLSSEIVNIFKQSLENSAVSEVEIVVSVNQPTGSPVEPLFPASPEIP